MITIKSLIRTNDWLEVTWSETLEEVETTIHCESFSGHPEHIAMLDAKASEFGTSLDEYKSEIEAVIAEFKMPTEEEIQAEILAHKIQEANSYLSSTDWVKDYKLRHDLGLELIPESSSKWVVITKREEYLLFLKGL